MPWSTAWTEYALYFLFAFHSGLHDAFHVTVPKSKQHILQDTAVWDAAGYAKWDVCLDTLKLGRGYLSLVQSNIGLDPAKIWDKVSACLPPTAEHKASSVSQKESQVGELIRSEQASEGTGEASEGHGRDSRSESGGHVKALLAEDEGSSESVQAKPTLLLMHTKMNLRAAAHKL